MKIAFVNEGLGFHDAMKAFNDRFMLKMEWVSIKSEKDLAAGNFDLILIQNKDPEKFSALSLVQKIRNNKVYSRTPICFLTEPLSESVLPIYEDLEMVWKIDLPFNSGLFFKKIDEISIFLNKNFLLLNLHDSLTTYISKKDWQNAKDVLPQLAEVYNEKFFFESLRS